LFKERIKIIHWISHNPADTKREEIST